MACCVYRGEGGGRNDENEKAQRMKSSVLYFELYSWGYKMVFAHAGRYLLCLNHLYAIQSTSMTVRWMIK